MKGSHICVTSPSYMRRLAGPASCSYRTLGLMLLFKGVCCTLTVHMAREVLTTAQIQCLFCSVLPAPPLFAHLVYILYIKFSKKSKNKRSNSLRTAPITFALILGIFRIITITYSVIVFCYIPQKLSLLCFMQSNIIFCNCNCRCRCSNCRRNF